MRPYILRPLRKAATASAFCIALAGIGLTGCTGTKPLSAPKLTSVSWPMTPGASETYYYLLLSDAIRHNKKAQADEAVRNLLMMEPPVRVYVDAASYYSRRKDPVVARSIIKDGMSRFPEALPLTLLLAETYLQEKRFKDAQEILREYISLYPDSVEARQELGMLLFRAKQYPEAADILGVDSPARHLPLTRYYYARVLSKLKRYNEAVEELQIALKALPDFIEAWAELAFVYELQKDLVSAEETYEHLISIGHAGEEVWLRLVDINLKLNRPDQALELARRGPALDSFAMQAASLLMEESFFEQAKELLTPYIDNPNAPEAIRFHLALIAYNLDKDYRTAVKYLEGISDNSRLWDRAAMFRSQLLFEMGEIEKAIETIDTARRSDPGHRGFWEMQTDLLASSKRYKAALKIASEALERWKNDPELLFTRASVLERMNRKEDALKAMEKVIEVDPQHAHALNFVGYSLAVAGKDLDRALVLIEAALKQEPDTPFILDSLAWVQFKLGRIDEAWETINRVIKLGLKEAEVWEHYGDIAKAKGLKEEARKGYERALASQPPNADELIRKLGEL